MNDHVSKPIDPDALYATLERWVKPGVRRASSPRKACRPARRPPRRARRRIFRRSRASIAADGLARVAGNARLFRSLLEQFASEAGGRRRRDRRSARARRSQGPPSASRTRSRAWPEISASGGSRRRPRSSSGRSATETRRRRRRFRSSRPCSARRSRPSAGLWRVRAVGSPPDATAAKPYDAAAGRAAIGRLRKLLASSDGGAADAFAEVSGTLAGAVARPGLEALGAAIDEFDFEGALSKLDAIAGECGAAEESA